MSANHQFGDAAQAARILPPLESVRSGKLARLVIGMLTDGQPQLFGDAVVADRLGREPGNKPFDIIKYRHRCPICIPWAGASTVATTNQYRAPEPVRAMARGRI